MKGKDLSNAAVGRSIDLDNAKSTTDINNADNLNIDLLSTNPDFLLSAGDVISKSLIFTLGRNYLDDQIFKKKIFKPVQDVSRKTPEVSFFKILTIGQPIEDQPQKYLKAIQTFISAAHDPRYRFLYILSSDGYINDIFIGIVSQSEDARPSIFAEQLGQFLSSSWPGTKVQLVEDSKTIREKVYLPLSRLTNYRAMTGIPTSSLSQDRETGIRISEQDQSIDQLIIGMRGKPFMYIVVADPIPEREVREIIQKCRTISGQVHAFTKSTINRSRSQGESDSVSQSSSTSTSNSISKGSSKSSSSSVHKTGIRSKLDEISEDYGDIAGIAVGVALFGSRLRQTVHLASQLLPSQGSSQGESENQSSSESSSESESYSETKGQTISDSLSFGQEYLNRHAEACEKILDETVSRFESALAKKCWNVGVFLLCNESEAANQAQSQLHALMSGERSKFEPIRMHNLQPVWKEVQVSLSKLSQPRFLMISPSSNTLINHPLGNEFENLTTPLSTDELSVLTSLPVREIPGLPVQKTTNFSLNPPKVDKDKKILLGKILDGGLPVGELSYSINTDSLSRHIFITGITGSGKSNTCRRIIHELMAQNINFMVIEPAKTEYLQLAMLYNEAGTFDRKIAVYAPGRNDWYGKPIQKLHLNPFDLIIKKGVQVQVLAHLDRLKSIFNSAFPMEEILPVILEEALVDVYKSEGWLDEPLPTQEVGRPNLESLYSRIDDLVSRKGYEKRIIDNISAALKTRIGSLMRGWKNDLFNHRKSTPWEELFDRPVVVNLQQMGDDADKCLTMGLLLNFLYEYRQAQHELSGSPESANLKHFMIIEEAHRILRNAPEGNPISKMGEMFSDMLAEIRAYGQGFGIIDQVPAKLIPDAIKNTNLKIIHRLVAGDDRETMAKTIAISEDQAEIIAKLKVGQTIVCGIKDDEASWVQIEYTPLPNRK